MAHHRLWLLLWGAASLAWIIALSTQVQPGWRDLPTLVLVVFLADAGSYFFHYFIDHYGDPARGGLVCEFQKHHKRPLGIVEKSLSEVFGPAAYIATPALAILALVQQMGWLSARLALLVVLLISLWVLAQLFHRWAHMSNPPWAVRQAQRLHLLVSPAHHGCHHRAPYESHFAVITGWSNHRFDRIRVTVWVDALAQALGFEKRGLVSSLKRI